MNKLEKQMVKILARLCNEHGATAVKASLEAEGILPYELMRTKEITMAAGVGMTVKIGGCEAITDARMAKGFGVNALMSPMIESRFALEKFLAMASNVFDEEDREDTKLLINIETLDGCEKLDQILRADNIELLDGIVLGRTDLSNAMKVQDPDNRLLFDKAREIFGKAKEKSIRCLVGGGITTKTVPFLSELNGLLDGFETRKVVFGNFCIDYCCRNHAELELAIHLALEFEYYWYLYRKQIYQSLFNEDAGRIKKLEGILGL